MCGIVGYIGKNNVTPILLDGLKKLEYRGYDSAGIAVKTPDGIQIEKVKGRLQTLCDKLDSRSEKLTSHIGIGHTRWATHGAPSDVNSHPHMGMHGKIALVHNGIIENFMQLKAELEEQGYQFVSETDTEVVAHLFESNYNGDLVDTMIKTIARLDGSFALGVMAADQPDQFVAVRKDSPLIVGLSPDGNFIASDIPAILEYTRDVYLLEDNEIVLLKEDGVELYDTQKNKIQKEIFKVNWEVSAAEKGGYDHFMFKEIMEEPKAVRDTVHPRISGTDIVLDSVKFTPEQIRNFNRIYIVACGSAYHVGMVGKYIIEKIARVPVEVDLASEFRYRDPIIEENSLVIIISQSGETADTLAALREAQKRGARVLSIVNVVGSSIARESDEVIYTWAGPEIAVATTKAYSTQLTVIYMIALYFAQQKGLVSELENQRMIDALYGLPDQIQQVIDAREDYKAIAEKFAQTESVFFIGRGIDYAVSMEGSLKLKEISYIGSEAYAAGELKHGTISLIDEGTVVYALATDKELLPKMISNIKEVKARGAIVVALIMGDNPDVDALADHVIHLPECFSSFAPSLEVVPLQLIGYYVSVARGLDVDKPKNLAKSVTVE